MLGDAMWESLTIDLANCAGAIPANTLVASPYSGQPDAPTSWNAAENRSPFASATQYENTYVGYPATIEGSLTDTLSGIVFTIADASGNNVPCMARTPQTTPNELTNGTMSTVCTAHGRCYVDGPRERRARRYRR